MYADDAVLLNIHEPNEEKDEIARKIRIEMKPILDLLSQRKLILNTDKTKFMIFKSSRNKLCTPGFIEIGQDIKIQKATSLKYLGLLLNETLNWEDHIKHLETKIAAANCML